MQKKGKIYLKERGKAQRMKHRKSGKIAFLGSLKGQNRFYRLTPEDVRSDIKNRGYIFKLELYFLWNLKTENL
jgi:hypothetical protein